MGNMRTKAFQVPEEVFQKIKDYLQRNNMTQALGAWSQRPIFSTNVSEIISVRDVSPRISRDELQAITVCFQRADEQCLLDSSFEFTNTADKPDSILPYANPENVRKFKVLQRFVSVDLVEPVGEQHMYFAAMNSKSCVLTPLGKYYWHIINDGKI